MHPIPAAAPNLDVVPFVSVDRMMKLVLAIGIERFVTELAAYVEDDFRRWDVFDKTPRIASHSADGVIELMPTSDGRLYGFKHVNGHPKNTRHGRQTVTAFGVLADLGNGYPMLLSEMTLLTALRTAATSALAAKHTGTGLDRRREATAARGPLHAPRRSTAPGMRCRGPGRARPQDWAEGRGTRRQTGSRRRRCGSTRGGAGCSRARADRWCRGRECGGTPPAARARRSGRRPRRRRRARAAGRRSLAYRL